MTEAAPNEPLAACDVEMRCRRRLTLQGTPVPHTGARKTRSISYARK
jgi:hypothetical protein